MLSNIIRKRKSTRRFDSKKIPVDEIKNFIEVAKFAPSGKNRQPWKILILDQGQKNKLLKILEEKNINLSGSLNISLQSIKECSQLLLIFNPFSYKEKDYSKERLLMDTQSIGAFIQNILLLATEKEISSLWINDIYYAKKEIEQFFVFNKMEVIAAIALGFSSKKRLFNLRKSYDDIIIE